MFIILTGSFFSYRKLPDEYERDFRQEIKRTKEVTEFHFVELVCLIAQRRMPDLNFKKIKFISPCKVVSLLIESV